MYTVVRHGQSGTLSVDGNNLILMEVNTPPLSDLAEVLLPSLRRRSLCYAAKCLCVPSSDPSIWRIIAVHREEVDVR